MERRGRKVNERQTGEREGKSRQSADKSRSSRPKGEHSRKDSRGGGYQSDDGDAKSQQYGDRKRSDRPYKSRKEDGGFDRENRREGSFKSNREGFNRGEKKWNDRPKGEHSRRDSRVGEYKSGGGDKSQQRGDRKSSDRPYKSRKEEGGFDRENRREGSFKSNREGFNRGEKKWNDRPRGERKDDNRQESENSGRRNSTYNKRKEDNRSEKPNLREEPKKDGIRLNKYIAHGGICSRREADDLIKTGAVTVNGKLVIEMGYKVQSNDVVNIDGTSIKPERKHYVLLNKPKGFITTTDDPHDRKTVMTLVEKACKERIYPVGRLDRNTSGLLLFTNDGEMAKHLTHPKYNVKKLYHAVLDKKISKNELNQLLEGVTLEDGFVKADEISFVGNGEDATQVGIALHSGKNRIVRRIFQHLGYEVVKLDRVLFAGLTKKELPRGRWRHLTEKELAFLKMK